MRPVRAMRHRRTSRPSSWRRCCRLRSGRPRRGRPARRGKGPEETDDHPRAAAGRRADRKALGRFRGGLTTKIHLLVDAACRPLAHATTAGQRHDSLAFAPLLGRLTVRRRGAGRPRTRPDRLLGDKAYSNRKIRAELRRRRIIATIPEKADQRKARTGKGPRGGRPPAFDPECYAQRNTVERAIARLKEFRAVAMRTDKREFVFRGTIDVASIKIWLRNPTSQDPGDTP
jgi:transposase